MEEKWGWPAIGIDLGARFSSVAVWQHGQVEILMNDQGNRKTPSYVAFTGNQCLVGDAAKNQSDRNPANTIFDAKKLLGRRFSDITVQSNIKSWPFKVIADPESDKPKIIASYKGKEKQFTAVEISSMVLMKMKETAEAYLGTKVKYAVITVPAYFNDSQRQATKDAGILAGFNNVRIINDPTAVAIAYGFHKKLDSSPLIKNVLVFDLGGRTLNVSVLTINKDVVEFKAVSGHSQLGGDGIHSNMAEIFIERFKWSHGYYVSEKHLEGLVASCEKAKRTLSTCCETAIYLYSDFLGSYFSSPITRARFEMINEVLFKELMLLVEKCLRDANMERYDIDYVVLVGGSTKIPKVRHMLQNFFCHTTKHCYDINTEEELAYGAAIHAAMLSRVYGSPIFPRIELHHGAAVEESFLVPGKRLRKAVQSRVQEPSPSLILQDVDSLLKELSFNLSNDVKYVSSSATQFLNLLKKIRRKPDDPKLTRQVSQSLKNFYPSIDKHWLTIIKSIEENLLVSQHQYLEWASKEAAIPLKQEEAGTTHNQLVSIKNKMVQKSLSQDQLRSKITVIDEELAKLLDRKSQLEVDLNFVEEDLCKLTRSVGAQLDLARKQSVQLACLREASNFKAKAKISMDASLDSLAKYFRNL
ncbi:heat shock 70 kDa protein 18-like [Spinacia oleracea]|uniref:Heat shock 70 kDa protein 18-like n=1 Tax=Spinacia oleracea TaxID=3562 RepID=A0A9R0JPF4_SPIOL|nr:heat shock 70 kDa protein 18-like [Spinacia oleracea]XP_056693800.1 heat shock 70 kDa protein 18-like [Spinacia oleracea]XP_056693801.1 heat shock 70 kDa protein 18-like [Spinacia oleracea]XP_056693802.1 heat shock 70 kDa protein 18-like [Spinacia oleracea]XP_056693803.1 heat shock 70 kDa protein 18-like [Spinacia oleracea]